jgi:hypothetical protein
MRVRLAASTLDKPLSCSLLHFSISRLTMYSSELHRSIQLTCMSILPISWNIKSNSITLLIVFKRIWGDTVDHNQGFVRVSHQDILSRLLLLKQLNKHAEHGPHLSRVEGDLRRKVLGPEKLRRQYNVLVGILG